MPPTITTPGEAERRRSRYHEYLKSGAWDVHRWDRLVEDDFRCQVCGAEATEVHHRRYSRIFREDREDLISVCHGCHEDITTAAKTVGQDKAVDECKRVLSLVAEMSRKAAVEARWGGVSDWWIEREWDIKGAGLPLFPADQECLVIWSRKGTVFRVVATDRPRMVCERDQARHEKMRDERTCITILAREKACEFLGIDQATPLGVVYKELREHLEPDESMVAP